MARQTLPPMEWYAIAVQPGRDDRVRIDLKRASRVKYMERYVGDVVVPRQLEVRLRSGARTVFHTKAMANYVLAQLRMSDDTINLVRGVGGVLGLLPHGSTPAPLDQDEVDRVLARHQPKSTKKLPPKPSRILLDYSCGDEVYVAAGPMKGATALVTDIDERRPGAEPEVTVAVTILGREVSIKALYWQLKTKAPNEDK